MESWIDVHQALHLLDSDSESDSGSEDAEVAELTERFSFSCESDEFFERFSASGDVASMPARVVRLPHYCFTCPPHGRKPVAYSVRISVFEKGTSVVVSDSFGNYVDGRLFARELKGRGFHYAVKMLDAGETYETRAATDGSSVEFFRS